MKFSMLLPLNRACLHHRVLAPIAALTSAGLPLPSLAALPQMQAPSKGGSGIMQILQNHGSDIAVLVGLLLIASMFIGVCYHAYAKFAEIHTGRATWGQFGLTVAVGALLLVIGIWLLNEASNVL